VGEEGEETLDTARSSLGCTLSLSSVATSSVGRKQVAWSSVDVYDALGSLDETHMCTGPLLMALRQI